MLQSTDSSDGDSCLWQCVVLDGDVFCKFIHFYGNRVGHMVLELSRNVSFMCFIE